MLTVFKGVDTKIVRNLVEKYRENTYAMFVEYPHKSHWLEGFKEDGFKNALKILFAVGKSPALAFYLHIPFCPRQCYFCSCYSIVTRDYERVKAYLSYLFREIDMLRSFFDENSIVPNFKEIHFGGGSPSYLQEKEFDQLMDKIQTVVDMKRVKEVTIEIDPRETTREKMEYYHQKGINRISMGIQDFDIEVQKAVNRIQPIGLIERLLTPDLRQYFTSVNFDILCGLPKQTFGTFRKTMETLIRLSPDRSCLIYLTYIPDVKKHQRFMDKSVLPTHFEKLMFLQEGVECLLAAGYKRIGLDHFAKPTDRLTQAMERKDLHWNALGYRAGEFLDIIGVGISSASIITKRYYSQDYYELHSYEKAIESGRLPIYRGFKLGDDEVIRRDIIHRLRTYFTLDCYEIEKDYNIDFEEYFQEEKSLLDEFVKDEILEISNHKINITDLGIHFTYLVCRIFDRFNRLQKTC